MAGSGAGTQELVQYLSPAFGPLKADVALRLRRDKSCLMEPSIPHISKHIIVVQGTSLSNLCKQLFCRTHRQNKTV